MIESSQFNPQYIKTRKINRVLLISLPVVLAVDDSNIHKENVMHLGLGYLAAVLRENNYDVKILDCYAENMFHQREKTGEEWVEYGLSNEQIIEQVKDYTPDLIGISIPFSCQHYIAHDIARFIKGFNPDISIVSGGNHVTAASETISAGCFDYLVMGEGEYSFIHLLSELNNCDETNNIARIYPNNISNQDHIFDLDELPFPALDLMPLPKLWHSRPRWINMVATRGCVYSCIFCSIHTIMGYSIRRRSVDNVISEILKWKREYGIQEIYFEDDNLTADKKWAKDLFKGIAELKLGIRFHVRNGIRADTIDKELLLLMRKAGFQDINISPETGNQRLLNEIIGKKARLEDYENAIKIAREVGLEVNTFFVFGFPEETWEDLRNTVTYGKHLQELGAVGFWFSTATPFPGTRLYIDCVKRGLVDLNHFDYRRLRTVDYVINHPVFSKDDLLSFQRKVMEEFSPRKLSLLREIIKKISLIINDPTMFYAKLRFKLYFYYSRISQLYPDNSKGL